MDSMKIKIENEKHQDIIKDILSAFDCKYVENIPENSHSLYIYIDEDNRPWVSFMPNSRFSDSEKHFQKSQLPEYKLKGSIVDDKFVYEFVKLRNWKFNININQQLVIVDSDTNQDLVYVIVFN